jgi:hypothetical protein
MTELAQAMATCEGVDTFQTTGIRPDRFFALLADLYAAYDAYIAHNLAASELKIQCRFGCTRCCHQAVHGVYSFEIINLYRQLRPLAEYGGSTTHSSSMPTSSRQPWRRSAKQTMAIRPIRRCALSKRSRLPPSRAPCSSATTVASTRTARCRAACITA